MNEFYKDKQFAALQLSLYCIKAGCVLLFSFIVFIYYYIEHEFAFKTSD